MHQQFFFCVFLQVKQVVSLSSIHTLSSYLFILSEALCLLGIVHHVRSLLFPCFWIQSYHVIQFPLYWCLQRSLHKVGKYDGCCCWVSRLVHTTSVRRRMGEGMSDVWGSSLCGRNLQPMKLLPAQSRLFPTSSCLLLLLQNGSRSRKESVVPVCVQGQPWRQVWPQGVNCTNGWWTLVVAAVACERTIRFVCYVDER